MHTTFNIEDQSIKLVKGLLLVMCLTLSFSCKKNDPKVINEEKYPEYSYEVTCDYCDISYTDVSKKTVVIINHRGDWKYTFKTKVDFELKLAIKTTLSTYQKIEAYILKDAEAVYGNLGYNHANISYNVDSNTGNNSFGQFIPPTPSGGSNPSGGNGGNPTPTSPAPVSSVCGAKNKTGGYCRRVVSGGGRCWQHK